MGVADGSVELVFLVCLQVRVRWRDGLKGGWEESMALADFLKRAEVGVLCTQLSSPVASCLPRGESLSEGTWGPDFVGGCWRSDR